MSYLLDRMDQAPSILSSMNTTHQLTSIWVQYLYHMTVNTCCFPSKHCVVRWHKETNAEPTNWVCFLQAGEDISAISPSLWLPVSQREYTGYCTGLHSHMVESGRAKWHTDTAFIFMITGQMVAACMNVQQQGNMETKRKECSGSKYKSIFYSIQYVRKWWDYNSLS